MKMNAVTFFAVITVFASSGCATRNPGMRILSSVEDGEVGLKVDKALVEKAAKIKEAKEGITIYRTKLPEGFALSDDDKSVQVKPEYRANYQFMGEIESDFMKVDGSEYFQNWLWVPEYTDSWRNVYCGAQAPLKALTLGTYSYMPTFWVCNTALPSDEDSRLESHMANLKKMATVMDGDVVILVGSKDLHVTTVSRYSSSTSVTQMTALKALVFRTVKSPKKKAKGTEA
ncbi:MAG: hypothetical protein JNL01_14435 [Bdellovibrionales bacterium]|nr:hypothetical protein [Bdellovibrionales bacterium]